MLAVALKASAEFLTLFNARALPYISANFLSVCTGARANPNPNPNPDPDPNPNPNPNQEMGKLPLPKPERKPQGKAARRRADPEEAAQLIQGLHKLVTAFEALVKSTKHFETEAVRT